MWYFIKTLLIRIGSCPSLHFYYPLLHCPNLMLPLLNKNNYGNYLQSEYNSAEPKPHTPNRGQFLRIVIFFIENLPHVREEPNLTHTQQAGNKKVGFAH